MAGMRSRPIPVARYSCPVRSPGLLVRGALEQARVDQFAEALGGDGLGDADASGEVVEPAGAVERLAHEEHRRARTHHLHRAVDRAAVAGAPERAVGEPPLEGDVSDPVMGISLADLPSA